MGHVPLSAPQARADRQQPLPSADWRNTNIYSKSHAALANGLSPPLSGGDDGGNGCNHRYKEQQAIAEPRPEDAPSDDRNELDAAHNAVTETDRIFVRRLVEPSQIVCGVEFQLSDVPSFRAVHVPPHAQHVAAAHQVDGLAKSGDGHLLNRYIDIVAIVSDFLAVGDVPAPVEIFWRRCPP